MKNSAASSDHRPNEAKDLPRFRARMKQAQAGGVKALFFLLLWTALLCRSLQLPVSPTHSTDQCACRPRSEWERRLCPEITQQSSYPDHRNAFGFGGSSPDWSCLPGQVEENHRACYRTTIADCGHGPQQCFLKPRNPSKRCDSEGLLMFPGNGTDDTLQMKSPKYDCQKKNGKPYNYRHREFCIYNVSMPCRGTWMEISALDIDIQPRSTNDNCVDYLEFDFGPDIGYTRVCGNDTYRRVVETRNFLAVFWTDTQDHHRGFDIVVQCLPESVNSTQN